MRSVELAVVALLALASMAFDADDARQALDGQWRGPGLVLTIDMQAGEAVIVDATAPVQQGRFEIKKVAGQTVLFTIGDKRYVGSLAGDKLLLMIGNDPFTQTLKRVKGQFGTPSEQSVSTEAEANAPPLVQVMSSGPDRPSTSSPVQDTPSSTRPPAAIVATPPQDTAPVAQLPATKWTIATGSLALQAPTAGALAPASGPSGPLAPAKRAEAPAASTPSARNLVDINAASINELNRLGGRFGKAIIAGRPYRSIDELVSKRILTRAVFDQIKEQITTR